MGNVLANVGLLAPFFFVLLHLIPAWRFLNRFRFGFGSLNYFSLHIPSVPSISPCALLFKFIQLVDHLKILLVKSFIEAAENKLTFM